jgi:hypothetical protein
MVPLGMQVSRIGARRRRVGPPSPTPTCSASPPSRAHRPCGLGDRTGSLTRDKDGDIVLIRAEDINTVPPNDAATTVVTCADTSNVDTVIARGEIRKRAGKLVGVDMPWLRQEAEQSRD